MVSATLGALLVAASMLVPLVLEDDVNVNWPPLHADWDPRVSALILPAVAIGLLLWIYLPRLAATVSWGRLLILGYVSTWVWTAAVALTEGTQGLSRTYERRQEYIYDAQRVDDIGMMLQTFITRIPFDSVDNWYVHVAGHPPGAFLIFIWMDRLGISDPFWIGVATVTLSSTAIVALLVTLRALGSIDLARRALPWVVLAPTVVWMGVNGDAIFTAVAAWGLALLALAATRDRHRIPLAVGAGVLLGYCVYLSYGLTLLGILSLAVLFIAKNWRPLPWALGGALAVAAVFTAAGFVWWDAYPVLVERYYDGIASRRAYGYWVWANLAAWTFTAGLAVWAAFPAAIHAARRHLPAGADAAVLARLAAAAALSIVAATLSGMSKAEVERIWMPFTLWLVALPLLLPQRWHRPLLLSQVVLALTIQHLVLTRW
ncbi:hypothetical protein HMPREF0063_12662 [Aeromicrobium marinum DSM 15272]|uniref:Tat pathway signal sequence domain protein n=1 Tax=Aeromicrobium marinum DSM 15272 TaxID=585531 RepID=E2SF53_9ACTN|nr:hypothetical protein HMPREF0063_12662 [Aeromicrobium marinum DSM 15272]